MAFSDPQRNIAQLGVSEGMRVADFGAGSGFYTLAAAKKVGYAGAVYAIDIQPGLLGRIQDSARGESIGNVQVLQGDLEQEGGSKLADATVDIVLMANVLFQVEHKGAFVREAWRVLRPTGRLLLVDWKGAFGGIGPHPSNVVSETRARELVLGAGFVFDKHIQAGDHHYGMVFRKPKA